MRNLMKLVHWANLLLLFGLIAFSVAVWPELPERIPVRFDAGGHPTRWVSRSFSAWFLVPMIALATAALTYGLTRLLPRRPQLINTPDKQRFLALPAARRAVVVARMQEVLYWFTASVIVHLGIVQWTIYRAAMTGSAGSDLIPILIIVSLLMGPLMLIAWAVWIQPEFNRQIREHEAEQRAAGR